MGATVGALGTGGAAAFTAEVRDFAEAARRVLDDASAIETPAL
ncbi:hypothetical protein RM550_04705 [Streptomyces sp. DSM 41527]|uniref:Uncharacterized protein n=1 Tax=Streptomyces mooreae TaxID=3075523 RepID=A0ABU2T4B4_9ACTN|nr:hypothetical protein [Streptomyces sp. DSM 41527]MDT0455040.1 hypothetical protein [Streptomyces sp. DSM 41527]